MDILEAVKRLSIHPVDEETPQGIKRSYNFRGKNALLKFRLNFDDQFQLFYRSFPFFFLRYHLQ